ncbi:acetyltransferase [Arthrobacter sp. SW1]|uniref:aminoglycoside phosphotransferase family protein n=1 Tax=Arthrobacter sp. SW1 TaxID=1920889 RepID=UPI000877C33D|nr:aminoglycoside phosphotransferase family protein [Arthrobacter sp. SW1]OFI38273.1 acetyltransferase [Arthrobacter sp. SW1]
MVSKGRDGRAGIDAALVRRLIAAQFPEWRDLPVEPVAFDGWDNRTYRLGEDMTVRLPTAAAYVPAVVKENEWIPRLAPFLPVDVPPILGMGTPGEGYGFPWSVRGWLDGIAADQASVEDLSAFALAVADFLLALQSCSTEGAPPAGAHSFYRGASPSYYDDETRFCLKALEGRIDTAAAAEVWDAALDAECGSEATWFHGDVAAGNLLVADGALSAVIDFGTCGVGDAACDLVIAWTMFSGRSRAVFRDAVNKGAVGQDDGMWARARGWALWKALLGLVEKGGPAGVRDDERLRIVHDVVEEHRMRA